MHEEEQKEPRRMTNKELTESLGVTPRTIQQVVEKLGLAKSILQVKIRGQNSSMRIMTQRKTTSRL